MDVRDSIACLGEQGHFCSIMCTLSPGPTRPLFPVIEQPKYLANHSPSSTVRSLIKCKVWPRLLRMSSWHGVSTHRNFTFIILADKKREDHDTQVTAVSCSSSLGVILKSHPMLRTQQREVGGRSALSSRSHYSVKHKTMWSAKGVQSLLIQHGTCYTLRFNQGRYRVPFPVCDWDT
jgi:hypothetical protein